MTWGPWGDDNSQSMYELTVERRYRAAHAITMGDERETSHEHDWRVVVRVGGPRLDDDGLLCDFHALERSLDRILAPLQDHDLNATPPFDRINPTAEHVARHLYESMAAVLPDAVKLRSVEVTEAPGCTATYFGPS